MISSSVGYITNADVPNYEELINVIDRVIPITDNIQRQPAMLYEKATEVPSEKTEEGTEVPSEKTEE